MNTAQNKIIPLTFIRFQVTVLYISLREFVISRYYLLKGNIEGKSRILTKNKTVTLLVS